MMRKGKCLNVVLERFKDLSKSVCINFLTFYSLYGTALPLTEYADDGSSNLSTTVQQAQGSWSSFGINDEQNTSQNIYSVIVKIKNTSLDQSNLTDVGVLLKEMPNHYTSLTKITSSTVYSGTNRSEITTTLTQTTIDIVLGIDYLIDADKVNDFFDYIWNGKKNNYIQAILNVLLNELTDSSDQEFYLWKIKSSYCMKVYYNALTKSFSRYNITQSFKKEGSDSDNFLPLMVYEQSDEPKGILEEAIDLEDFFSSSSIPLQWKYLVPDSSNYNVDAMAINNEQLKKNNDSVYAVAFLEFPVISTVESGSSPALYFKSFCPDGLFDALETKNFSSIVL